MKPFKQEPYPCFPEEWENPENTLFREFYLRSSPDFALLRQLVEKHMSELGNEGITRCRLIHILRDEENRAFYLLHQRRRHPLTWRIRWWLRLLRQAWHRRFRTRKFRTQLILCRTAKEICGRILLSKE